MIDSHTHIYLPEFDDDRDAAIQRAADMGVKTLLMPAIDSTTHDKMLKVEMEHSSCRSMMGLHPCSVNDDYRKELNIVRGYLTQRPFVAIGEIGLDFYWDKTFTSQQYEAFHEQIRMALDAALPIVIHSRNAIDECIDVVKQYPGITGVFHCFTGNAAQARNILATGLLLGIGGVVTFKNSGLDKVLKEVGMEGLILETDAPYLAPVPFRGKRNEPSYTRLVAEKLAALFETGIEEIAKLTSENCRKVFKL
ncbi:MAG TPA: TatD family hydrolase [Flavisolibacter sp.]|nr:TatD family hydrolase [Flavisolibacter sp.]